MAAVLVVEDEQWVADCFSLWLGSDGHSVRHSSDAQEAIDMIDDAKPDAIILDLFLPLANGVQVLQTLRSHADLNNIPIVLCSSALPDELPDLKPYGVRSTFDKASLTPVVLRRALNEALNYAAV